MNENTKSKCTNTCVAATTTTTIAIERIYVYVESAQVRVC